MLVANEDTNTEIEMISSRCGDDVTNNHALVTGLENEPCFEIEDIVKAIHRLVKGHRQTCRFVVALTSDCDLISARITNIGTTDECSAYLHDIFRDAIIDSARMIVVIATQPNTTVIEPSPEDFVLADILSCAGVFVDIVVWDYVIVGKNGNYHSFREMNDMMDTSAVFPAFVETLKNYVQQRGEDETEELLEMALDGELALDHPFNSTPGAMFQ